jgi:hypothetical protein
MKARIWLTLVAAAAVASSTGCGVDIAKLNKKPEKYDGKTVKLKGLVREVQQGPRRKGGEAPTFYQINDGSDRGAQGYIWVLRGEESKDKTIPRRNHNIDIKGVVQAELRIGSRTYSPIIIEHEATQKITPESPGAIRLE